MKKLSFPQFMLSMMIIFTIISLLSTVTLALAGKLLPEVAIAIMVLILIALVFMIEVANDVSAKEREKKKEKKVKTAFAWAVYNVTTGKVLAYYNDYFEAKADAVESNTFHRNSVYDVKAVETLSKEVISW